MNIENTVTEKPQFTVDTTKEEFTRLSEFYQSIVLYLVEEYKQGHERLYARIMSVSRSGMSRTMRFYTVKNNEIIDITDMIASVIGKTLDRNDSIRVGGCGMDMIFHVLTQFAYRLSAHDYSNTRYGFFADRYRMLR